MLICCDAYFVFINFINGLIDIRSASHAKPLWVEGAEVVATPERHRHSPAGGRVEPNQIVTTAANH